MNSASLTETAQALLADGKGLLAMDESNATCNKRFAALDIPQTEEFRRAYRELIVTTPQLSESILFDETIRQQKKDGTPFVKVLADEDIIPGIKGRYWREGVGHSSGGENHRGTRRIA